MGLRLMSDDAKASKMQPVFLRPPSNWGELTQQQKHEWALQFLDAAIDAADPEDRPKLNAQPEP
jgi:hypothetical protein